MAANYLPHTLVLLNAADLTRMFHKTANGARSCPA